MPEAPILFAGDPHGNFTPILRACSALAPGVLILLGDCDCRQPLAQHLHPAITAGWQIHWILGNRDTETEAAYDHLTQSPGNLALQTTLIGPWRIAGLPGVFKPRIWEPPAPPSVHTRAEFQATLRPDQLWRNGLPLWHRDTIFPEDLDRLRTQTFDVLVTHEAPTSHPHGHREIDDLAATTGARLIVHGHHHQSYAATLPDGIAVRGLGLAEPWLLDLPPPSGRTRRTPAAGREQVEARNVQGTPSKRSTDAAPNESSAHATRFLTPCQRPDPGPVRSAHRYVEDS